MATIMTEIVAYNIELYVHTKSNRVCMSYMYSYISTLGHFKFFKFYISFIGKVFAKFR